MKNWRSWDDHVWDVATGSAIAITGLIAFIVAALSALGRML